MKLKDKDIEVGYLYQSSANQYRAVLAIKGEFMIYAPSLEGTAPFTSTMPFDNQPFKKCQNAEKRYFGRDFMGYFHCLRC